ncbi:MAG: hypothetical protein H6R09_444 [Proteobacteria bacterium]|nr:hypothetical protein [Pseudomonadota bacterium]
MRTVGSPPRAVAQHAEHHALVEAGLHPQHRVDLSQRDDLLHRRRIDRGQRGIELAGVFLVHDHGHPEARLAAADGTHCLEAAHVSAHQEGAALGGQHLPNYILALHFHLKQVEAGVEQEDPVVDG